MGGEKLGARPLIHESADVRQCRFGRYTEVGARTSLIETELGDYSYIVNDGEVIYTTIGKFCSIAAMVRINPGNHPMWRVSQSHFTYRANAYFNDASDEADFFAWRRGQPVEIGHDVWIGHGAIILPGRRIGNGSVIGAGAVVTTDVEPYTILVGVPARPVRHRFKPDIAARIEALGWWDWEHDKLENALPDFRTLSPEDFLNKYGG